MDNKKHNEQYTVREMNPPKQDKNILSGIPLPKTRDCLDEHENKKNGIYDLQPFAFHAFLVYNNSKRCQVYANFPVLFDFDNLLTYSFVYFNKVNSWRRIQRCDLTSIDIKDSAMNTIRDMNRASKHGCTTPCVRPL